MIRFVLYFHDLNITNFMYQAMIFSFKVSQNFIVHESAEDRNLRAFLTK